VIGPELPVDKPTLLERLHLDRRESRLWVVTGVVMLGLLGLGFKVVEATRDAGPPVAKLVDAAQLQERLERLKLSAAASKAKDSSATEPQEIEIVPEGHKMFEVCGLGRVVAKTEVDEWGAKTFRQREDDLLREPLRKLSQHSNPRVRSGSMLYGAPSVALLAQALESSDPAVVASSYLACAQQGRVPEGQQEQVKQACESLDPMAWARLEPHNGHAWRPVLIAAQQRGDEAAVDHALRQISQATSFERHESTLNAEVMRLLDDPSAGMKHSDLMLSRALLNMWERKLDSMWRACDRRQPEGESATRKALCKEVANQLLQFGDNGIDRTIASRYLIARGVHTELPSVEQQIRWALAITHLGTEGAAFTSTWDAMGKQPHDCENQRLAASQYRMLGTFGEFKSYETLALREFGSREAVLDKAAHVMPPELDTQSRVASR
jgi:hypothetical protein